MSRSATDWAWKQPLKPSLKLVLLSMSDRANEFHECFPSYARLEKDTGLNRKTISAALKKLAELNIIRDTKKRVGRTGQVVVYELIGLKSTENGTVKESHFWNPLESKRPKNGTGNSTKNGTIKQSQKRYSEPPNRNHPIEPERGTRTPGPIPEDFTPSEVALFNLEKNKLEPLNDSELFAFISHYQGTGEVRPNWDAVYQKWVVNQRRNFKKPTRTAPPAATPPPKITNFEHLTRETTEEERKQNAERLKAFQEAAEKNGVKK